MASVRLSSFLALVALLVAVPVQAAVVDGVVAAIDGNAVALSVLQAYQREYAGSLDLAHALDQFIDDRLLAANARRYGQGLPAAELEKARGAHPVPPGLTAPEWDSVLSDHELATRFLAFRFGDFVPVSREQEQKYYDAHRAEFPGSFASAEAKVRAVLLPRVRQRRERSFKQELRRSADLRIDQPMLEHVEHASAAPG